MTSRKDKQFLMKIRQITLAAAIMSLAMLAPVPAFASEANGVIGGAGAVSDDWGDEGPLSMNSHKHSWATGLWQSVLVAEGAQKADGSLYTDADIDCDFGPVTQAATIDLQKRYGLKADGIVGTQTFSFLDGPHQSPSGLTATGLFVYTGTYSDGVNYATEFTEFPMEFRRNSSGLYLFYAGGWRTAYYNSGPSGSC
jgi:hypothetical protein